MTGDTAAALALLAATLSMGLAAGTFVLYAHTVMPGLRVTDDRTFVAAFQALDRRIVNTWCMLTTFLGALLLTGLAVLVHWGGPVRSWAASALVLYGVTFVVTVVVNVPMNNAIKAAGPPGEVDPSAVRRQFDEGRWVRWNLLRVATTTAAFALLGWSLVVLGRSQGAG